MFYFLRFFKLIASFFLLPIMSSRESTRDQRPRRSHHYRARGGEAMPLRLPRMRSRKKKGRGEGDSESIASGGSDRTLEGSD